MLAHQANAGTPCKYTINFLSAKKMQAINPNFVNLILNAQTQLAQHTHSMKWSEPLSNSYQPWMQPFLSLHLSL